MPRATGFTLLEMLVVLVILGLSLTLVVPLLGRSGAVGLTAAAIRVRATLQAARAAAIAEGRPVEFRSDGRGGYWLGRQYYQAAGSTDAAAPARVMAPSAGRIAFLPSGGSTGGRIFVEDAGGRREIDVDAVTGNAAIAR